MALFASRDAHIPSSRAQVSQRAAWNDDGRRLLGTIRQMETSWIQASSVGLRSMTLDLMARAAPAYAEAVNAELVPVAQEAFDRWPVKTGLSKSVLRLEIKVLVGGKELSANLVDLAPYAAFINRGRTVTELVWKPGREAADRMADRVVEEIAR